MKKVFSCPAAVQLDMGKCYGVVGVCIYFTIYKHHYTQDPYDDLIEDGGKVTDSWKSILEAKASS